MSGELGASKDIIHRQIKTLGKSYKSCRFEPYELVPQQVQRRMVICRQLIGNPIDDIFIRIIVTYDEKCSTLCKKINIKQNILSLIYRKKVNINY